MAGGTLSPCGRENSPYRHPANKDSISTPELGEFFVYPLAEGLSALCASPFASENLLKASWGRPSITCPPNHQGPPVQVPAARASKGNVVFFLPTLASAISCTVRIRINASCMLSLSVGQAGADLA